MSYKQRLERNPYEKPVLLSEPECAALLADETPCSFCGAADTDKTHENVGQARWREPYARGNAFALCRSCFKVRRGRSLAQLRAYAAAVVANVERRHGGTDPEHLLVAARAAQRRERPPCALTEAVRQRYERYVRRETVRPLNAEGRQTCAWGALGEPRRQGGASDSGRTIGAREFCALMHARRCFYCGTRLCPPGQRGGQVATLDRIDSSRCYSPRNVVVSCGACNQAKSRLSMVEFVRHLVRLARLPPK